MRKTKGIRAASVRNEIAEIINRSFPGWSTDGYICHVALHDFRMKYVHSLLESEEGELSDLEQEVLHSLKKQEALSEDLNYSFREKLGFKERLADRIAFFGRSWGFF